MPDEETTPIPAATTDAVAGLTPEPQLQLIDISSGLNTITSRYIGESLSAETMAQVERAVDEQRRRMMEETMSRQVTSDIDAEFASSLMPNPAGHLTITDTSTARIDDLLEVDFHTSHSGVVYPAIDRLVGSVVTRHQTSPTRHTATATIYYHNYDQLRTHLNLNLDGGVHRGMVWHRGEYWYVDQLMTATAVNGGYEATLELTLIVNSPPGVSLLDSSPGLVLTENEDGQLEWTTTNEPDRHIALDFSMGESTTVTYTGAIARLNLDELPIEEPVTVLKKARCAICRRRGCSACSAEKHDPQSALRDAVNAAALDEPMTEQQTRLLEGFSQVIQAQSTTPPVLGRVVELHGDTAYIRMNGDLSIITHELANTTPHLSIGMPVTINADGHIIPANNNPPYSPPNQ